ncbi:MAG: hypothetical protein HY865_16725 [Chloroflexi bacterium]|nr:hypothetical protein [Chloroflexota bacterium]
MNDIFDILEICLQEIENGAEMETVLARHPDFAAELRPILMASIMARSLSVPAPSPEAVRRGRAKVLQHAALMRETKSAPRSRRAIPFFQRFAIAFTLAAVFLAGGTGLVSASASALPGENLYPVKLTWENVRLFFTLDKEARKALEYTFEIERLHEVNELLAEGWHEVIQFVGIYTEENGVIDVSGVRIVILDTSVLPAEPLSNGAAVLVTGRTNADGFVEVESIELLPEGTSVPAGMPVEIEAEPDADDLNNAAPNGNDNEQSEEVNENNGNDSVVDNPVSTPVVDGNQNETDADNLNSNDENNVNDDNGNDAPDSNQNDNNNDDKKDDNKNDESNDDGDGDDDGDDD